MTTKIAFFSTNNLFFIQDQYANYVVQKMIDVAESSQVSLISSLFINISCKPLKASFN